MTQRDFFTRLLYTRQKPLVGRLAYILLKFHGAEIPRSVKLGHEVTLEHGGTGVVVHSRTEIGSRVKIYPGVTLGRADVHLEAGQSSFEGIHIGDDVILSSGAKVLCREGVLRVGRGTIVGANAVLLQSTGEYEIWAGVPAQKIGLREDRN